jgi:uncharacterized protein (TIGR02611 family)
LKNVGQQTKRIVVTIVGLALLIAGGVLLVLPGPGILVVIAGLAVLASEYDWARDALEWVRERYKESARKLKARSGGPAD